MEFTSLSLRTRPGRRDELVAYYHSAGILVTALRADAAAYDTLQNSPQRQEFAEAMMPFFDSTDAVSTRGFHVAHHIGRRKLHRAPEEKTQ